MFDGIVVPGLTKYLILGPHHAKFRSQSLSEEPSELHATTAFWKLLLH